MQLTEVEAAFRALKSELSIRPLFHQLERRRQPVHQCPLHSNDVSGTKRQTLRAGLRGRPRNRRRSTARRLFGRVCAPELSKLETTFSERKGRLPVSLACL